MTYLHIKKTLIVFKFILNEIFLTILLLLSIFNQKKKSIMFLQNANIHIFKTYTRNNIFLIKKYCL